MLIRTKKPLRASTGVSSTPSGVYLRSATCRCVWSLPLTKIGVVVISSINFYGTGLAVLDQARGTSPPSFRLSTGIEPSIGRVMFGSSRFWPLPAGAGERFIAAILASLGALSSVFGEARSGENGSSGRGMGAVVGGRSTDADALIEPPRSRVPVQLGHLRRFSLTWMGAEVVLAFWIAAIKGPWGVSPAYARGVNKVESPPSVPFIGL